MNQNRHQQPRDFWIKAKKIKKRKFIPILPTLLICLIVVALTLIPKSDIIKLQIQNDRFTFVTDYEQGVRITPITDARIEGISLQNFESVRIGYKTLYRILPNGESDLVDENGVADFIPQLTNYEIEISDKDLTIGSLDIEGESLVNLSMREKADYNEVLLEVQRFPAFLKLLFPEDSVFVSSKRCLVKIGEDQEMASEQVDSQEFLVIPSETISAPPITGVNDKLSMVIRISKEALRTVFASEIDIKQIGYSESDLSGAPEATIKAKCMLLQIGANQKLAFHDQITYFKKQELNQFKLESIDFISERPDQITLNFNAYISRFAVGLQEDHLKNVVPSLLGWLASSEWAVTAAILAWLITSSLLAFDIYYRQRKEVEERAGEESN